MKSLLGGLAKKRVAVFCIISLLLIQVTACSKPPEKITFGKAIASPKNYLGKKMVFREGVVVFKKKIKGACFLAVAAYPFSKVKNGSQIIVVKVNCRYFNKVGIGSKISSRGRVLRAKKNKKEIFYISARDIKITGHVAVDDPNFDALVKAINQKDAGDLLTVLTVLILLFPGLFFFGAR